MADDPTIEEGPLMPLAEARVHAAGEIAARRLDSRLATVLRTLLASHASLEERVEEAKRLMKPFAGVAGEWEEMGGTRPVNLPTTVGDLRALAAFVNEKEST